MPLSERTILITGSAQRIGRSLALATAKLGADLVIHYNRSRVEAATLQAEIQDLGRQVTLFQSDFTSPLAIKDFTENVFGSVQVDTVINSASIFTDLNWKSTSSEDWINHQNINLLAPFLICQSFAKYLPEGKKGRIINLLDWRAFRPGPDHLPYTISKSGLASLTKSLAISLAPKITVNGIALGAILPPSDGGDVEDLVSTLPIPRWADMTELVDTLLFLLTGPEYITGEIIHLDGGRHLI